MKVILELEKRIWYLYHKYYGTHGWLRLATYVGQVTDTVLKLIYLYNRLTDLKKKKPIIFPHYPSMDGMSLLSN